VRGRKAKPELSRGAALDARPVRVGVLSSSEESNGELRLVLEFERARWIKLLDGREKVRRTFILDALGREVYEACDGRQTVKEMIAHFAKRHKVSLAEAEYSVTTYLKTLVGKGLIAMEIDD
jgi:hypothetical protein